MATEGSGTTMAASAWMHAQRAPDAHLDAIDQTTLEAVDIRRQQVFTPVIVGQTSASSNAWRRINTGTTLEAGIRLKLHGGATLSTHVAIEGKTGGGGGESLGYELRPGEEIFLEINNAKLVSIMGHGNAGSVANAGLTLSYIGN